MKLKFWLPLDLACYQDNKFTFVVGYEGESGERKMVRWYEEVHDEPSKQGQ
jgi:hypothetical protein